MIEFILGVFAGSLFAACYPKTTRNGFRLLTGGYWFKDQPTPPDAC